MRPQTKKNLSVVWRAVTVVVMAAVMAWIVPPFAAAEEIPDDAVRELAQLDALYERARSARFAAGPATTEMTDAATAFIEKWLHRLPAHVVATARTYQVRGWVTAQQFSDVLRETAALLAIDNLSDADKFKVLYYRGVAAVHANDKELAQDCVQQLRPLNRDIANNLQQLVTEKWVPITVGEQPPQWELARVGADGTLKLQDLHGKYVLLDFWATWCGPCRAIMQRELAPMHEKYEHDPRLVIVSVGTNWNNDTAEKQAEFARANNYRWPKVFDATGEVTAAYGVRGIPTLTFIDPAGKVIVHGYANQVMPVVKATLEKLGPLETPEKPEAFEDF